MTVEIKIFGEDAEQTLRELHGLSAGLGGPRLAPPYEGPMMTATEVSTRADAAGDKAADVPTIDVPKTRRGRPPKAADPASADVAAADAAARQIGENIDGSPRRETIPAPAISTTPEDRVNPDDEAGDEADGIEDMQEPGAKLTIDDLRNAAGRINRALGNNPAKAQELAAPAFVKHGVKSISTCPDDKLEAMIAELNGIAAGVEGAK